MIKIVWKILIIAAVLLASGAGFMALKKPAVIHTVHPLRGPAVQAVYATGTVEATVMLPVAPRQSARLVELLVDEGQVVEKDTVMARLEDGDLQKMLAELQAQENLAQKEYARKNPLAENGVISKESIDRVKAELDKAIAAVERARVNLDYMKLMAPESGTVIRRDGEIGELIPVGQPVFWMACCGNLRIDAEVDEEDIPIVRVGQKAVISADAFPDEVFHGIVQGITPKGDALSRSYRVRIDLPPGTKLMIGMTAETNIVIREVPDALLLPASAIQNGRVGIVQGDRIVMKEIETGAATPEATEIRSGLTADDTVVRDLGEAVNAEKPLRFRLENWRVP